MKALSLATASALMFFVLSGCSDGGDVTTVQGTVSFTADGVETGARFDEPTILEPTAREGRFHCVLGHCERWEGDLFGELDLTNPGSEDSGGFESLVVYDPSGDSFIEAVVSGVTYTGEPCCQSDCTLSAEVTDEDGGHGWFELDCLLTSEQGESIRAQVRLDVENCPVLS